jgi:hypothetical protein
MFSFTSSMFDVNDIVRPDVQYPLSQGQGGGSVWISGARRAPATGRAADESARPDRSEGDQLSARWQEAT